SAGNTVSTSSYQIGSSNAVSVLSADDAQNAIGTFDSMISYIDHARSQCGAVANRLEHTISYQEIMIENVSDARSRIRDTDYAAEIADMARNNILQQVATTMLTHALRSHNSMIMSLLGAI
ncbi:MAG: flagellin, partial [Succinivibrionaceae bacterium]|nr:flagellin [Succinivibrionaceae bacterium]